MFSFNETIYLNADTKNIIKKQFNILDLKFKTKVAFVHGDIRKNSVLKKIKNLIKKRWNGLDGIVANAGSVKTNIRSFSSEKDFYWYQKNNFLTAFRFVNYFLEDIKKNKGSIVFISSIASLKDLGAPLGFASSKSSLAWSSADRWSGW